MTDSEPVVLAALGLDADTDYAVPDHLFASALAVALDPDTPAVDASSVPIMDDHGTVPDGVELSTDDPHPTADHHAHDTDWHDPANHDLSGHEVALGDDDPHLDPTQHDDHHDSGGAGHDPGHDSGPHDTDWHI